MRPGGPPVVLMETASRRVAADPVLRVGGVTRLYPATWSGGEVLALAEVTFEVPAGQFVAIVGPSGCGKSTLLNLVAGIDRPSTGAVELNGRPVAGPGPERGIMFQQYVLFPWMTVRGNVEFGPRSRKEPRARCREIAARYLALVGLETVADRYPHELSGGMQQRCALARVLANDPLVLLMDEPLAAVDAQTRSLLQEELLEIWGEGRDPATRKTVLYVTHAIDEAVFLADRVLVMGRKPGRLIADLSNDLPRPRVGTRRSARFGELVESIWALLHDQAAEAARQLSDGR
jgi:NitT/TauT family transport system ATP-binding protein